MDTFIVETIPSLAAVEDRLRAWVVAHQSHPLERLNIITGSNLQRLAFRRLLAAVSRGSVGTSGASANVHFFTPVDLAVAIRSVANLPPRQPLPDGGDVILLDALLHDLHAAGRLRRLDPAVQGLVGAVASSITDLREADIEPEEFITALRQDDDSKLHDLATVYAAFQERFAAFGDRTGLYEDALDPTIPDAAIAEALASAPLLVLGLYDAPAVQVRLLARCAQVIEVLVLLPDPEEEAFAFARSFRDTLQSAGASVEAGVEARIEETTSAPATVYLSAPSRQAEAEEIVRRMLATARETGTPFDRMAVLHRLDHHEDDLLCTTLERAGVPFYRAAGQPVLHTPPGRGTLALLDLLLHTPQRHQLLEVLANPALRDLIPPGIRPKPALWERHSKQAGLVAGWDRFAGQLRDYEARLVADDRPAFTIDTARELARVVTALRASAEKAATLTTWKAYAGWFDEVLSHYVAAAAESGPALEAIRQRVRALALLDDVGVGTDGDRFHAAVSQAVRRTHLNDRAPLTGGVFVGTVASARWLRFDAVFLAECAERIFPPMPRPDPILLDGERRQINSRLKRRALALKRDRRDEELLLFRLVQQSARERLTLSWARRTNTTGVPKLPSPFLIRAASADPEVPATVDELYARGVIPRMPARLAGTAPPPTAVAAGDWSAVLRAVDGSDFRLAVLEPVGMARARQILPRLWAGVSRYDAARQARNDDAFSAWDGMVTPSLVGSSGEALATAHSPTALETYATCPYRYFLRHVLRVGAVPEPGDGVEMSPLDRGLVVHRILEQWVRQALKAGAEWSEYVEDVGLLLTTAKQQFDNSEWGWEALPPATRAILQEEIVADLRELHAREQERAAAGQRPRAVEKEFKEVWLETLDGATLQMRGRIDRIDEGPEGLTALDYKTGWARLEADAYQRGEGLQLPVYVQAVAQEYGRNVEAVSAEYWYATRRGEFTRVRLPGAALMRDRRFGETLQVIADGIRAGRFFPYPGEARGGEDRPNCRYCDYAPICSTDVADRFGHKQRQDHETVRAFLTMKARGKSR